MILICSEVLRSHLRVELEFLKGKTASSEEIANSHPTSQLLLETVTLRTTCVVTNTPNPPTLTS